MRDFIKYNTDNFKLVNSDYFIELDFSHINNIQFKSYEDGSKEIIMNEHNKFDFSLNSVRKI